jgi:hypothetical protein
VQILTLGRVDEFRRVEAESLDELAAAGVRLRGYLDHRRANRQLSTSGHVGRAQIEVDEQLIAREVPAARVLRYEGDNARVHEIELHVGMRCTVRRPPAAAVLPAVADQAVHQIELSFLEDLALADLRAAHDHREHAVVPRRPGDFVQAGLQFAHRQMSHRCSREVRKF